MLDTVAELESRNIAVTAGFRNTKQLLAGMLNLSPTEAGTRVTHAGQLAPRRALTGEVLAPVLPNRCGIGRGEIGPAQVRVITAAHRRPVGGRVTRKSSRSYWVVNPNPSTLGARCGLSRCPFAVR